MSHTTKHTWSDLVRPIRWAHGPGFPREAPLPISGPVEAVTTSVDQIRLMTYNIHFGVGPIDALGVWPSRDEVLEHLDGIVGLALTESVDVLCLQEVDLDAARSGGINQVEYIADKADYPWRAVAPVWNAGYIPWPLWPPRAHMGRTYSAIAVLSRIPLRAHQRTLLPKPEENHWWYNQFYLERAVQRIRVDLGSLPVTIFNLHLEAFGKTTRMRQARLLVDLVRRHGGSSSLICGDFNALPPYAKTRHDFADEPDNDMRGDATMAIIEAGLPRHLDPLDSRRGGPPPQTAWSYPATNPNRRLDYALIDKLKLNAADARVIQGVQHSDHCPLVLTLQQRC